MRSFAAWISLLIVPVLAPAQEPAPVPIAGSGALVIKDGVAGTPEGHAIGELLYWITWEDYDLAEAAYRLTLRDLPSPSVRFVRSWSLLCWAAARKQGFDRAVAALEEVQAPDAALREHVAALLKSVRAVLPCKVCDGKGRVRCPRCHGRGELRGESDDLDRAPCGDCDAGERACASCLGPRPAPSLGDICAVSPCGFCDARGLLFKAVRVPCGECRGLGRKLVPKSDPRKILP